MAPVPTPPVNTPDLSEEEAARTPNGYPNYYDKIAKEEQDLRDKIEGDATPEKEAIEQGIIEPTDSSVGGTAIVNVPGGDEESGTDKALEPTENYVPSEGGPDLTEERLEDLEVEDASDDEEDVVLDEEDNTNKGRGDSDEVLGSPQPFNLTK